MYSMVYATQGKDIPLIIDEGRPRPWEIPVNVHEYALPGSEELADQCEKALGKEANSCLLHSMEQSVWVRIWTQRLKVATVLEATARILYMIEATGGKPAGISPENVAVMKDFAKNHYGQEIAGYKRGIRT